MLSDTQQADQAAAFVARVLDATGDVAGAGFVVGPGQVATCAHVVSAVLGGSPEDPTPPPGGLRVDLPLLGPPYAADATVRTWRPIDPATGVGDVAILELAGAPPRAAGPPPLHRPDRLWGHRFRVLGFPAGMQDGVWTGGELRERQGTRWLQLQTDPHGPAIAQGFSGAPVWDEDVQAVVGMTVASDLRPGSTTAYLVPIEDVLGADPRLLPNPYRGLEPFGEEHADVFYGREDEVDRLEALLDRQPLVAVVGRSGTGKSSLVRAGLLPRLRRRAVRIVELLPAPADEPASATLDRLTAALDRPTDEEPDVATLLFADQFEELVGATPAAGGPTPAQAVLRRLVDEVRSAPPLPDGAPSLRVVLTLRWEAMNELLTDDVVETFEQGTFSLAAMSRDQLRRAVVGPAARAPGLAFEPGLVERILDDAVAEPGQLPLVESLLAQLWESRQGGTLTADAYDRLGGVKGAIARHAEQAVGRLTGAGPGPPDAPGGDDPGLRRLFTALARPDDSAGFVRRPARLEGLSDDQRRLVESLARSRLLVLGQEPDGDHTVELAHQALIDHWPRLRRWLDEDRDFLLWHHEVDRQRQAWERAGHDQEALLRGVTLARATEWLQRRGDDVTPPTRAFVEASRGRQRRTVRRRRSLLSAAALAAALVLVLGTAAVDQRRDARREAARSASRSLATLSTDTAATDPALAMLYALAGHEHHPTAEAERALFRLYAEYRDVETVLTGAQGDITYAAASRDGRVIAAMTSADRVTVWVRRPGRPVTVRHLERPPTGTAVTALDVTPDGDGVLVVESSRAWYHDVATGERRWEFPVGGEVASVALRDDGAAVLSMTIGATRRPGATIGIGGEDRLEVWEPRGDGARRVAELVAPPGLGVGAGGFGPRDDMVVVRTVDLGADPDDVDSRLQMWDTRTGELTSLTTDVGGQALSPDGNLVMACHQTTEADTLELIDLRSRRSRTYDLPPDSDCGGPSAIATSNDVMVLDSGKLLLDLRTGETTIQPSPLDDQPPIHVMAAWEEGGRHRFLAHDVTRFAARELTTDDRVIRGMPSEGEGLPDLATVPGAVHLSPDGEHLVSVLESGRRLVVSRTTSRGIDFPTVAAVDRPPPHQPPWHADLAVDQDRSLVADRVAPDRVQVRRLPGLDLVSEVTTARVPEERRTASAVQLDSGRLLTSNGVHLEWWDPATGEALDVLDLAAQGLVRTADATDVTVRVVPGGGSRALVALVDPAREDVRIVDCGTGRVVETIRVGRDALEVAFQPDSPYLALYRRGGAIEIWDREERRRALGPVTVPEVQGDLLAATSDVLVRGGFLPERGEFLLATGATEAQGPRLRWYDVESTTPERALELGPPAPLDTLGSGPQPVGLSTDGRVALFALTPFTTSMVPSAQVMTLDLRPEAWRDAVCRWVDGRRFTDDELATVPEGTGSLRLC